MGGDTSPPHLVAYQTCCGLYVGIPRFWVKGQPARRNLSLPCRFLEVVELLLASAGRVNLCRPLRPHTACPPGVGSSPQGTPARPATLRTLAGRNYLSTGLAPA